MHLGLSDFLCGEREAQKDTANVSETGTGFKSLMYPEGNRSNLADLLNFEFSMLEVRNDKAKAGKPYHNESQIFSIQSLSTTP